jgi:hypothetical protein
VKVSSGLLACTVLSFAVAQFTDELAMSRKPWRGQAPSDRKYKGSGQLFLNTTFPKSAPCAGEDPDDEFGG